MLPRTPSRPNPKSAISGARAGRGQECALSLGSAKRKLSKVSLHLIRPQPNFAFATLHIFFLLNEGSSDHTSLRPHPTLLNERVS